MKMLLYKTHYDHLKLITFPYRGAYTIPLWEKIQRGMLTEDVKDELQQLNAAKRINEPVFVIVRHIITKKHNNLKPHTLVIIHYFNDYSFINQISY
jgi:hypothetical protein